MSQKQISERASQEVSRALSVSSAEGRSRKRHKKKDRNVEDSDASNASSTTRSERSLSRTRISEYLLSSTTAPSVSVPCIATATCTTSTFTTVSTPISATGIRPPLQFTVNGTGQVTFAKPISSHKVAAPSGPAQISFFPTQGGIAPKQPLYKQCQKCLHGKALSVADGHQWCINCLGPDHCMTKCHYCNLLHNKALAERARRLIWWRARGLPACPSAKLIREIVARPAGTPEILGDHQVAQRLLESDSVPLSSSQQIPHDTEPLELIPLDPHQDDEVNEETITHGAGIGLLELIRAGGATQLPIGHVLDRQGELPRATKPVQVRDSSSNNESHSSSSSSSSPPPSPPERRARSPRRSANTQQQIDLDAVLAKHLQLLEDSFSKRFDRLEQDVRKVSERVPVATASSLEVQVASAAAVTAVSKTVPQVEAQGQDTIQQSMKDRVGSLVKTICTSANSYP